MKARLLVMVAAMIWTAAVSTPAGAVEWLPVERASLVESVRLDGMIEAVQESTVSAQTAGTIVELPYDVDDVVEAGALIARLDDTEQRARLEQARANLDEAEASLEDARQRYERVEPLAERGVASQSDLDQARNALSAARARVTQFKSAIEEAREQFDYTRVTAPYGGIITARHVELGESVRPGQPLLSGFALDPLRVIASVPQRYIDRVGDENGLRVVLDDGRELTSGRITRFPFADAPGHGVTVRIAVDNGDLGIYPGQLVRVMLPVERRETLWIPAESLLRRSELRAVFVRADSGEPRLRQVRIGARQGDRLEVLSGLSEGEEVALDPEAIFARSRSQ
ncbi:MULTISPECIES: efflux RND transporter periplasmic adaptor subunit [unclassified Wenzhouxiangella]|uniref:efflux RND transporter periplasmic adaptor subunit n=1 Tax=unclassified Wenzhouxiangella TaxID=2613841 RepID=UPI000E327770|nr:MULTISPECIES: efflux RND transporter periplasmic adaptor subunit [unclassified Wenzhouxiangella]RFF28098.1 efflux RND transporter periplasmic adaptor subunit [Wenzhouxiangella sp. 15181]RFP68105.1 efflux RND transporter periplasmic adaptor subunit [Wenzhouxiangella sp. 15190]